MIPLIIITAIVVYVCRLAGFFVRVNITTPNRERFLHFIPLSVFPALIAVSLLHKPELVKIIALASVAIVIWFVVVFKRRLRVKTA